MKRPQMPKGQTPYTGPFCIMEVLGWYSYRLSDGQKWNTHHFKHILPNPTEWTEFSPLATTQPQEGEGDEVVDIGVLEAEQRPEGEAILPGPVAAAPVEPRYSAHEHHAPDRLSMDTQLPQKKGRKNDVSVYVHITCWSFM